MSRPTANGASTARASLTIDQPAPPFLGEPVMDALLEVCLELAGQLWRVRDRLAVLERVLSEHTGGADVSALIEEHRPTAEQRAASKLECDEFVSQVLRPFVRLGGRAEE